MGSKQIRSVVPEYMDEKSVSFKRQEDGTYKKITASQIRNLRTNKIVLETDVSDERYSLVAEGDYDHKMILQDCSGNDVILKFKLCEEEESDDII
jgi:hypothetical protein